MDKSLILPVSVLQPPQQQPLLFAQYLTYSNITGAPTSFADLMQVLGTLRRSDVVRWTSTLIEVVGRNDGYSPNTQTGLIRDLLDRDLGEKVLEMAAKESNCVIFHRRQFWLLLQLASIASKETTEPGDDTAVRHTIGRACLMASDCLAKISDAQKPDDDPEKALEWLIIAMLSNVDTTSTNETLARAHAFWFESLSDPKVREELDRLGIGADFNNVFAQKHGMTLQEFFFIAASLYFMFLMPATKPKVEPALIDMTLHSGGLFSEDDKKRVLAAMSLNIVDMPAFLLGTPRQSWATDFSPLQAHPLIEVFPDKFTCPDLSFYRHFFVEGIYWMLDAAVGTKRWGNVYAGIYEWHINQLISCFTVSSDFLVRTFAAGKKYQSTTREVCDGLIYWGNTAVFCEYKGTRLNSRAKAGIDTIAAIEKMCGSEDCGAGQLAKSIALALAGNKVPWGSNELLDLSNCERIIPVLILHEEAVVNHAVRTYLQNLFTDFLKAKTDRDVSHVGPLLLFSTRDIELLEQLARRYPAEKVFHEYLDFVEKNPRDPRGIFHLWARERFAGQELPKGLMAGKLEGVMLDLQHEHETRRETD